MNPFIHKLREAGLIVTVSKYSSGDDERPCLIVGSHRGDLPTWLWHEPGWYVTTVSCGQAYMHQPRTEEVTR